MPSAAWRKLLQGREHQLLIPPAPAATRRIDEPDGRFAAGDEAIRPRAGTSALPCRPGGGRRFREAFAALRRVHAGIAQRFRFVARGVNGPGIIADHQVGRTGTPAGDCGRPVSLLEALDGAREEPGAAAG